MTYQVVYHCDANPSIGMGHLARGLDVLTALRRLQPTYKLAICGKFASQALQFMHEHLPCGVDVLPSANASAGLVGVLDTMYDPQYPEAVDELRVASIAKICSSVVLVSSSRITQSYPPVSMLIDHIPDVQILGHTPNCVRSGYDYVPVSSEFLTAARSATQNDSLVALIGGNAEPYGPAALLQAVPAPPLGFDSMHVVVSPHVPPNEVQHLRQRYPRVYLHQNLPTTAILMGQAKTIITTYGNATYESLSLHKPTFVVAYKSFQDEYAKALERDGLVRRLGYFKSLIAHQVIESLCDECLANSLVLRASQLFGVAGIDNIAHALIELVKQVHATQQNTSTPEMEHVSHA